MPKRVPFCPSWWSTLPVSPHSQHSYGEPILCNTFLNLSPVGSASLAELWLRLGAGQKREREEEPAQELKGRGAGSKGENADRGVDLTILQGKSLFGKRKERTENSQRTLRVQRKERSRKGGASTPRTHSSSAALVIGSSGSREGPLTF